MVQVETEVLEGPEALAVPEVMVVLGELEETEVSEALAVPEEMGEKEAPEGSFVYFLKTSLLYCFPQGCLYGGYKHKRLQ